MKKFYSYDEILEYVKSSDADSIYNYIEYLEGIRRDKIYGLVWEKEKEDFEMQLHDNVPVLVEVPEKDITCDLGKATNILIEGDNLHALKILGQTHRESIDVIYIDPPYNTGAKDWKYNNSYVEKENAFRHSKWICMMEKRVKIAKTLLKEKGVFICAIDENELAALWLLLEDIFGASYAIDCISVVHNPRGVQGKNFSYVHEYALFVYKKGLEVVGTRDVALEEIEWSNFRNWGDESERNDAANCFYPIFVRDNQIIGFGDDITKTDIHPKHQTEYDEENDCYKVWPIDIKTVERKWRYERGTVEGIQHLLRVVPKDGYFEIEIGKDFESYRTVWTDKLYDANEYGTKILNSMVPKNDFSYPKSVYNVKDCLSAVIKNNPNAVVLDFFAGSGTTAHAVQLINKEFGGNRQFILCTNNAVGEKREKEYKKKFGEINPKLKRWKNWCEKYGIASSITYPRIRSLYFGYTHSGDKKTVLFAQKIGVTQIKNDKLYKKMEEIKNEHKDQYDSIKFVIEDGIAKVIGITSKASRIEGIPANLKYYQCALIPKAPVPRKTLKALSDFIDCFITIKENTFEKSERTEPFTEFSSTRLNKQVFVYTKSYVDTNDLNLLIRCIKQKNVVLYVNEAIAGDEYLSELKDVQVKAIPRNILRGEFYE